MPGFFAGSAWKIAKHERRTDICWDRACRPVDSVLFSSQPGRQFREYGHLTHNSVLVLPYASVQARRQLFSFRISASHYSTLRLFYGRKHLSNLFPVPGGVARCSLVSVLVEDQEPDEHTSTTTEQCMWWSYILRVYPILYGLWSSFYVNMKGVIFACWRDLRLVWIWSFKEHKSD